MAGKVSIDSMGNMAGMAAVELNVNWMSHYIEAPMDWIDLTLKIALAVSSFKIVIIRHSFAWNQEAWRN